jgi:hypothetical protein
MHPREVFPEYSPAQWVKFVREFGCQLELCKGGVDIAFDWDKVPKESMTVEFYDYLSAYQMGFMHNLRIIKYLLEQGEPLDSSMPKSRQTFWRRPLVGPFNSEDEQRRIALAMITDEIVQAEAANAKDDAELEECGASPVQRMIPVIEAQA